MKQNNLIQEKITKLDIARAERESIIKGGKDDKESLLRYTEQINLIDLLSLQVHHLKVKDLEAQVSMLQAEQFDKQSILDQADSKYLEFGRELNILLDELRVFMNTGGRSPNKDNITQKGEFDHKITDLKTKVEIARYEVVQAKRNLEEAKENTQAAMIALDQIR